MKAWEPFLSPTDHRCATQSVGAGEARVLECWAEAAGCTLKLGGPYPGVPHTRASFGTLSPPTPPAPCEPSDGPHSGFSPTAAGSSWAVLCLACAAPAPPLPCISHVGGSSPPLPSPVPANRWFCSNPESLECRVKAGVAGAQWQVHAYPLRLPVPALAMPRPRAGQCWASRGHTRPLLHRPVSSSFFFFCLFALRTALRDDPKQLLNHSVTLRRLLAQPPSVTTRM